jgi:hypothetical protein
MVPSSWRPAVNKKLSSAAIDYCTSNHSELAAFMNAQLGVWEKMVKDADIKPN